MIMKRFITLSFVLISGINTAYSQPTMADIENDLLLSYRQVMTQRHEHNYEQVDVSNDTFTQKLLAYTGKYSGTFHYPFDSLRAENIDIVTSDDSLLRIYSWDTWTGGTMHDFSGIFQYKWNGQNYAILRHDTDWRDSYTPYYTEVSSFKTNGKTYYLAVGNGIYSSKDYGQSIEAFTIENGQVQTAAIFKQADSLVKAIEVYFDYVSIMDVDDRPSQLIKFDSKNSKLLIAEIDSGEPFANKYKRYKYNGRYFEAVGKL